MRNIKLVIEYDGTHFCGWQTQPNVRTVQTELVNCIEHIINEKINLIGSGRTDSGVHALGQVANFKTQSALHTENIKLALNGTLLRDIRVHSVEDMPLEFNARYSAKRRTYQYTISTTRKAIGRQYAYYCPYQLDLIKIRTASQYLTGVHDFEAFCKSNTDENHFLCEIESIIWMETGNDLIMQIAANRFVHNMVRIIVGTLIDVGRGKTAPQTVEEIIDSKNRKIAGQTVPAHGLCLIKVDY